MGLRYNWNLVYHTNEYKDSEICPFILRQDFVPEI